MSTIVAVRKGQTAVIGADTVTLFGSTLERAEYVASATKILRVGTSWLGAVGHDSWELVLQSHFGSKKRPPALTSRAKIFEMARTMHQVLKDRYYLIPREEEHDAFEPSHLDCLIVNPAGIFGLYSLRSVQEYTKFYAVGAGFRYALGAMHAVYDRYKTAESIAMAGLEASVTFDDSTEAPLEVRSVKLRKR